MSEVHTGAVCLPLITDLFTKQGLRKAFLVQIDDENPAGEVRVLDGWGTQCSTSVLVSP